MSIKVKKYDVIFEMGWILLLLADYFKIANNNIYNALNILGAGLIALDIAIHFNNLRSKEIIILIGFIILSIQIYRVANTRTPLMLMLVIFGARKKNIKQLFQISFWMKLILLVFVLYFCPILYYFRTGSKYYSIFATPNGMGLIFFSLVISYICIKIEQKETRLTAKERFIINAANVIIFGYCGCRTAFVLILFISFIELFMNHTLFRRFVTKTIPLVCIMFVIMMIRMTLNVGASAMELYGTVGSRWLLAKKYLDYYDIALFGNNIMNLGSFDFGFIALLIEQGIIYTIIFVFLLLAVLVWGIKENNKLLIALCAAVLLFYTMERTAFNAVANPLLLYFSTMITTIGAKRKKKVLYDKCNITVSLQGRRTL